MPLPLLQGSTTHGRPGHFPPIGLKRTKEESATHCSEGRLSFPLYGRSLAKGPRLSVLRPSTRLALGHLRVNSFSMHFNRLAASSPYHLV